MRDKHTNTKLTYSADLQTPGWTGQITSIFRQGITKILQTMKCLKNIICCKSKASSRPRNTRLNDFNTFISYDRESSRNSVVLTIRQPNAPSGPIKPPKVEKKKKGKIIKPKHHHSPKFNKKTKSIIIDGNNLLHLNKTIKELFISGQKAEACKRFVGIVLEYVRTKTKISELIIMYDFTKFKYNSSDYNDRWNVFVNENIVNETNKHIKLKVMSAIPGHKTSDDALVDMSSKFNKDELITKLFVTNDNELQKRLRYNGAEVMKSSVFNYMMKARSVSE
jgi:hypothetical protein